MKKFKLTSETINVYGITLFRIEALIAFANISIGEKGGYVEKESNLDHSGDAWVYGDAQVYGNAWVSGNARVSGNAWVYGNAQVSGNAILKLPGHTNRKTYLTIGPVGSDRFITIEKEHKIINAGCFSGTVKEFEKAVKEKYGDESDYYPLIKFIKSILK